MTHLHRRRLLSGALGLSLIGAGRVKAAAAGARPKLILLIARGALDGLSLTVPWADPNHIPLRRDLAVPAPGQDGGALDLIEGFGLHPSMPGVHALFRAGQVRFAPAVAIPARIRSHFDAQDVLESGAETVRGQTDGWLNRALAASGGVALTGLAVGAQTPLVLRGAAPVSGWAPGREIEGGDRIAAQLMDLYAGDPLLGPNLARGLETNAMAESGRIGRNDVAALGLAVARLMTGEQGADVVAVSVDGWDTHARQAPQMTQRLAGLDGLIGGLKDGLGEEWSRTVMILATEFGRTARVNGTNGTDHGTASSLLLMGGAIRAGGLIGDWPTLAEARLYEGRDLAPTLDVRAVFKGVLRDHIAVDRAALDTTVFPGATGEARPIDGLV
ncbi:DUF1501 domain-containing protein [Brevundimonas sp.]|jgi:uncharacterized protein (DUF1501 family)|uniref:DUF1501 domain-containing protein n=1 Tax=Brevundimonas sp. TaxID=1871086 RepID=UPI002E0EDCAE|nr:DUF1501 domain-containing protein [Brevundimonas sp.]